MQLLIAQKQGEQGKGESAVTLNNLDTATAEQKQQAINDYANAYAEVYGISLEQALVVAVDKAVNGAHYTQDGSSHIVINDESMKNAQDYMNTLAHEVTHGLEAQGVIGEKGEQGENYAELVGGYAEGNYEFALENAGLEEVNKGDTNLHIGNDSKVVMDTSEQFTKVEQSDTEVDYYLNKSEALDFDKELNNCHSQSSCDAVKDKYIAISEANQDKLEGVCQKEPLTCQAYYKELVEWGLDTANIPNWFPISPMSNEEAKAFVQQVNQQGLETIDKNSPAWTKFAAFAADPENQAMVLGLGRLGKDLVDLVKGSGKASTTVVKGGGADEVADLNQASKGIDGGDVGYGHISVKPETDLANELLAIGRVSDDVVDKLTPAQASRVKTIDNIIKENAKPHDFQGVAKELNGISTGFDHITEMKQSIRGLEKAIKGIEGSLKNPNLDKISRIALEKAHQRGQVVLDKMKSTLNGS